MGAPKRPVLGRVPWVSLKGLVVKVGHMEFMLELGLPLALDIWQGWPSYDNDDFEAGLAVIARVCHVCWMFCLCHLTWVIQHRSRCSLSACLILVSVSGACIQGMSNSTRMIYVRYI